MTTGIKIFLSVLGILSFTLGMFSDAAETTQKEYSSSVMLKKI
jgi:hypothetical protein